MREIIMKFCLIKVLNVKWVGLWDAFFRAARPERGSLIIC